LFYWAIKRKGGRGLGKVAGTTNAAGYIVIGIDGKDYYAHRLAWLFTRGRWPTNEIDHCNGVRSDNRILNLREADRSSNMHNLQGARRDSKTGVLGVSPHAAGGYVATIQIRGQHSHLGLFRTVEEAKAAYRAAKASIE
jgi:hypothetical protein